MLKLDEPFRNQEIFIISFFNSSDLGFESKIYCSFWLIFCPLNPDPWICIFFRIRILSTAANLYVVKSTTSLRLISVQSMLSWDTLNPDY